MGSRLRQLRLLKVTIVLAAIAGATVLVSAALGSSFPGKNGKLVYAVDKFGKPAYLATANDSGSRVKQISTPGKKQQGDLEPRFSADGTKVVFVRNPQQYGYNGLELWIANANGTGEHQVKVKGLPKGGYPNGPTFTPNGKKIVFSIDTINSPLGLAEVSVSGGKATQITHGDDAQPTVSPNGKKLAFFRGFTLTVANIDGSNPTSLYTMPDDTASSVDEPDFSPDGSTIAFMELSKSSGLWDIWTIAADGSDNGTATNLTNGTTTSSMDPAYSPDGTKIAFTSEADSPYGPSQTSIDVMPASGGSPKAVVNGPKGGIVSSPDWGVAPPHHKHHHKK